MEKYELTLYKMSFTRSLRVTWLAAELGILGKIKQVEVDLMHGEQHKARFRAMNKLSAVPTLVLTDKQTQKETVVTESAGICLFLTEVAPQGYRLKPASDNTLGLAAYYRMIALGAGSIDGLLWTVRLHEDLLPVGQRVAEEAGRARGEFLSKVVPALQEVLGRDGVQFVCEPFHKGFTTADVVIGYCCFWAHSYGLLEGCEEVMEYYRRVRGRRCFQEVWDTRHSL